MGLDTVELLLRCEEVYGITLPDEECGQAQTVGDVYHLVCAHLNLAPIALPTLETGRKRLSGKLLNLDTTPWTPQDVWSTLVGIFVDQLQIDSAEVTPTAHIQNDLGCD